MSERLIVSVDAPAQHPDVLRVEDAFEHIVELFELASATRQAGEPEVIWKLVSVSMNSPLTVVAEAVSARPGVDVGAAARLQKARFAENVDVLRRGGVPSAWSQGRARSVARRFVRRSISEVGVTKVVLDDKTITFADVAANARLLIEDKVQVIAPKTQIGSIEGFFLDVTTHYGHPAILMKERRTGKEVWCLVSEDHKQQISAQANFEDVWSGRRMIASGRIEYEPNGSISRVTASKIRLIEGGSVDLKHDPAFTDGMDVSNYVDLFREGNLGK